MSHERAALRVYVGYAAGVGKTSAMLGEGRRQRELGVDVVGLVEPHGRAPILERPEGLEVIPLRRVAYHGLLLEEDNLIALRELALRWTAGSIRPYDQ